ncbi:unnamed protein product [Knipowitschia caucasica]
MNRTAAAHTRPAPPTSPSHTFNQRKAVKSTSRLLKSWHVPQLWLPPEGLSTEQEVFDRCRDRLKEPPSEPLPSTYTRMLADRPTPAPAQRFLPG